MKTKLVFILSVLGFNLVGAQTFQAQYKVTMENLSLPEDITIVPMEADSTNSTSGNKEIMNQALNKIMLEAVEIKTSVIFNDNLRKITTTVESTNMGLHIKSSDVLTFYNKEKKEKIKMNPETHQILQITKLTADSLKLLSDTDTLINGKKTRILKIGKKAGGEELMFFFMDPSLPGNLFPVEGSFDPSWNVTGGVRKLIQISGNQKWTMELLDYGRTTKNLSYPNPNKTEDIEHTNNTSFFP